MALRTLAIDSAFGNCSVALSEGGNIICYAENNEKHRQAEILFDVIGQMLAENGFSYTDIEKIAVNIGPGSFTGIRIGLAAARGMGLAAKRPVVGVNGFEAIFHHFRLESRNIPENIFIAINAGRGQLYIEHIKGNGEITAAPCALDMADAKNLLENIDNPVILGSGAYLLNGESVHPLYDNINAKMVASATPHVINESDRPSAFYIRKPDAVIPGLR